MTRKQPGGYVLAPERRWYRVKDVARILEVSPQRVSQMAAADLIPHYRIGRTIKIDREEFAGWLESRRRGPAGEPAGGLKN